jgi:hypothetical protein
MLRRAIVVLAILALSCTRAEPTPATPDAATKPEPAAVPPTDPPPVAEPKSFARDDKAAVVTAFKAATGEGLGDDACVEWPRSFSRVVVVGGFANDRGCEQEGTFVDDVLHREHAELPGLATVGFADAAMERKEQLAQAWVDEVLHAFGGSFVTVADEAFGVDGSPSFEPVRARMNKIGGVVVEGWLQEPSGMRDESTYHFVVHRFAKDGALEVTLRNSFTVAGDKLRARRDAKAGG